MIHNQILDDKHIIFSDQLRENIFNLGDQTFVIPKKFGYQVVEVTQDYIARPDLVSLTVYGTDEYTDIICKLNGISNPFELNAGDRLVVPLVDDLYKFYYYATPEEIDSNETINTKTDKKQPIAKAKNDKRTANEAILGDERFRIDSNKRVIIY